MNFPPFERLPILTLLVLPYHLLFCSTLYHYIAAMDMKHILSWAEDTPSPFYFRDPQPSGGIPSGDARVSVSPVPPRFSDSRPADGDTPPLSDSRPANGDTPPFSDSRPADRDTVPVVEHTADELDAAHSLLSIHPDRDAVEAFLDMVAGRSAPLVLAGLGPASAFSISPAPGVSNSDSTFNPSSSIASSTTSSPRVVTQDGRAIEAHLDMLYAERITALILAGLGSASPSAASSASGVTDSNSTCERSSSSAPSNSTSRRIITRFEYSPPSDCDTEILGSEDEGDRAQPEEEGGAYAASWDGCEKKKSRKRRKKVTSPRSPPREDEPQFTSRGRVSKQPKRYLE